MYIMHELEIADEGGTKGGLLQLIYCFDST